MADVNGLFLMLPWMIYMAALAVTWKLSKRVTMSSVMQFVRPRLTALEQEVDALRTSLRKHTATHAAEQSGGKRKRKEEEEEVGLPPLERIAQGDIPDGISDGMLLNLFEQRDNGNS